MEHEINYDQDIRIDESLLDVEWLRQPSLVFKYNQHTAFYERNVAHLKEKLEVLKAELDKEIRTSPEAFDINKLTEATITATVLIQPEYQDLRNQVIEMEYELKMCRAATMALQDKKSALENLVKLHGMNYFAGPNVPHDISKEWEQSGHQKIENQKIAIGGKRRTS